MLRAMAEPQRDEQLSRIAETIRLSGGRSALYRWLKPRHDAFAALLAEKGVPPGLAGAGSGFHRHGDHGRQRAAGQPGRRPGTRGGG